MTTPRATYRLQLNRDFTFGHVERLIPYLDDLGISHVYLSPILRAQPGSTHGYDTVDHTRINPELGTEDDFRRLASALRARDMGIILDFVPNHMGVGGSTNALWLDVLKNGAASHYADWFDIDWHPQRPGMNGKLLVPFLGTSYAEALVAGQLSLRADDDGFAVWAYDKEKLPIRAEDSDALREHYASDEAAIAAHAGEAGHSGSWGALDALIRTQHWRLAHFSSGGDEINYRRFFINSELAGIRIDRPDVFEHAHALIFRLIADGLIDGLRIDHVDGLLDPKGYLEKLRRTAPRPIYLLIEKILAPHERLRRDWPVDGTTGYEVGAELTRLLMNLDTEDRVTGIYTNFVGSRNDVATEAYLCKLRVMDNELAAELGSLARRFSEAAWSHASTFDLTELGLRRSLRETIAQLAVYRTYIDDLGSAPRDLREIGRAIALARRSAPHIQPMNFDFVEGLLCGRLGSEYDPKAVAAAVGRFQQYTGPVMAKGLEDTALYRDNRLVALNEVGAHPDRFSRSIAAFHQSNRNRLATHPQCMLATSTHDTKRGEDTRAVIAAIADEPSAWAEAVSRWRAMIPVARAIHPNDLYLLFQLLLGGWPINGDASGFAERLKATMTKSLREARQRSDWGVNATGYEDAVSHLIDTALADPAFMADFQAIRGKYEAIGRRKALIQAALKLTIPGVPDIYRGAEDWEQSFVDPDNRRPLDFSALADRLSAPEAGRDDKLALVQTLLHLRKDKPELFSSGSYQPIECGSKALGFCRQHGDDELVVFVDLSAGHSGGLAIETPDLRTVAGSADGPFWVLCT